nr:ribonuclease H-like domain-containing protein [Tanacetum cinerariifolium]
MSYLSNFEEINGGYVAFGGNPKGDTECIVLSPEFKLPDENHTLLRVSRENNMYNVDLKNIVPSGDLTCLFTKATFDEFNLWHRRLGHINFKTMNKLVKEKAGEENVQQYVLFLVWSSGSTNPQNTDKDDVFKEKEHEFEGRKPESEVCVSPSNSAQTKKHDDKTKKKAKGKKLEDFTNSNVEEDVGAEADFTNLETTITVSPIPTTRVHKDHPVTQIIGDLSSATQTRKEEPKRVHQALKDPSWIGAMQEELLQFKMQKDLKTMIILTRFTKWSRNFMDYIKLLELDGKSASTPIYTEKPSLNDPDCDEKVGIEVCAVDLQVSTVKLYFTAEVGEGVAEVNVEDVPAAGVAIEGAASVADDDVPVAVDESSIPSPTQPPPPSQDIPFTSQVKPTPPPSLIAQPPSPPQQLQPSLDTKMSIDLLHTLLEPCITGRIITNIDADEDVILEDAKEVAVDAEIKENFGVDAAEDFKEKVLRD